MFITLFGTYCFNRPCFGISSVPEHFQKWMSQLLEGLDRVICQMDDILVYAETQAQHHAWLLAVLGRLVQPGVTLKSEKCDSDFREFQIFIDFGIDFHVETDHKHLVPLLGQRIWMSYCYATMFKPQGCSCVPTRAILSLFLNPKLNLQTSQTLLHNPLHLLTAKLLRGGIQLQTENSRGTLRTLI